MKKTLISVAAVAMSAGLVGVAAAASGDNSAPETVPTSATSTATSSSDDPATHDVGDDHGSGGHGADDLPTATTSVPVTPATEDNSGSGSSASRSGSSNSGSGSSNSGP